MGSDDAKGASLPIYNAASAFTAVLPLLLGGSALLSNAYFSVFAHPELASCDAAYTITTANKTTWTAPLSSPTAVSVQPITCLRSSDHRTFDVDASLCSEAGGHCCGYYDAAKGNALQAQSVPFSCRDLLFQGELYGFVYPMLDFTFEGAGCGHSHAGRS